MTLPRKRATWVRGKHGTYPNFAGVPNVPTYVQFWAKVDKSGECWIWLGKRVRGYGQFTVPNGTCMQAQRWAFIQANGPIAADVHVHHATCTNRACVRPDHMEAKGQTQHIHDHKVKTVCINGHQLTPDNVRMYRGQQVCRACKREWARANRDVQLAWQRKNADKVRGYQQKYTTKRKQQETITCPISTI